MLLAGDVGGTKSLLGLFTSDAPRPEPVETREFTTLSFTDLGAMVAEFLAGARRGNRIDAASFGVAGPVVGTSARLTNVPWLVDTKTLAQRFSIAHVGLLNDLVALAHAVPVLRASELDVLQEGRMAPKGNKALVAAGTGLGEAFLHFVEGRLVPCGLEAGHSDFAARTPVEVRVLEALTRSFGRASVEHIVSGSGLVNIHRVLHPGTCPAVDPAGDPRARPRADLRGPRSSAAASSVWRRSMRSWRRMAPRRATSRSGQWRRGASMSVAGSRRRSSLP